MKLELKHLAGYLPYDLLVTKNDWDNYMRLTLCSNYLAESKNKYDIGIIDVLSFQAKPILHPISDLTKEIEVNGEKFVPINRMELYGYYDKSCLNPNNVKSISYNMIQFLFEWHFDVFGLIEKGLAIDINTIK